MAGARFGPHLRRGAGDCDGTVGNVTGSSRSRLGGAGAQVA